MKKKAVKSMSKTDANSGSAAGKMHNRITAGKYKPSEEEVRDLAEILFHQRIDRGESGTPEDDWFLAEEYLVNPES